MLYKIEIVAVTGHVALRFNSFKDMTEALGIVTETVDGFEEGTTKVYVSREEEKE